MPLNIEGAGKISGLTDPAAASDAARKAFVEEKVAAGVELSGSLNTLDDVDTTGASAGDVLTYFDGEDAGWAPSPIDPPPSALNDLSDVNVSSPSENDYLKYEDAVAGVKAMAIIGQDDVVLRAKEAGTAANGIYVLVTGFSSVPGINHSEVSPGSWTITAETGQHSYDEIVAYINQQTDLPFESTGGSNFNVGEGGATFSGGVDAVPAGWYNSQPSTDNISEGSTNLYYTDARADARISAASVGELSDVDTTGAENGNALVFSSGTWSPQAVGTNPAGYLYAGTIRMLSSGTFSKGNPLGTGDIGLKAINVRMAGGGGAGGSPGAGKYAGAAGGGGGAYAERFILAASLSATETITVGIGGTGSVGSAGGSGTASIAFGITSGGGAGGGNQVNTSIGGAGGSVSGTVDFSVPGLSGGHAYNDDGGSASPWSTAGGGGHCFIGHGAPAGKVSDNLAVGYSQNGQAFGGGGSGGMIGSSATPDTPGGNGATGVVIIDLYV